MSSLLGHCHGENWKSPTRSFGRSGKAKRTFEERKKNVFVKPNEQRRACSDIVMARIGNRQHGALGEVERQNALFEERKRTFFCSISTIIITKGQGVRDFFQYLCKRQASVNGSVATRRDNARRVCPLLHYI